MAVSFEGVVKIGVGGTTESGVVEVPTVVAVVVAAVGAGVVVGCVLVRACWGTGVLGIRFITGGGTGVVSVDVSVFVFVAVFVVSADGVVVLVPEEEVSLVVAVVTGDDESLLPVVVVAGAGSELGVVAADVGADDVSSLLLLLVVLEVDELSIRAENTALTMFGCCVVEPWCAEVPLCAAKAVGAINSATVLSALTEASSLLVVVFFIGLHLLCRRSCGCLLFEDPHLGKGKVCDEGKHGCDGKCDKVVHAEGY